MDFNMLKEAISVQSFDEGITKRDYTTWLRVIKSEAKRRSVNLTARRNFDELAFEVLDNDPKMDLVGNHEASKSKIVNTLWQKFQAETESDKTLNFLTKRRKSIAREEEESVGQLFPGEKGGLGNVVKSPSKFHSVFQTVISDGYNTGKNCVDEQEFKKIKNPYTQGTSRHKLWQKSLVRGHQQAVKQMIQAREEEEAVANIGNIQREGFIACAQAYAEMDGLTDERAEFINPYDEDTDEGIAYETGWRECEDTLLSFDGTQEDLEQADLSIPGDSNDDEFEDHDELKSFDYHGERVEVVDDEDDVLKNDDKFDDYFR